ncbi:hypothetical protein [Kitasatospora purpeofusca]|uniref:hypothetical protein n=1 Tax=Kitasatospora purpeofusca TaxID=67352 RepID=UPI0036D2DB34
MTAIDDRMTGIFENLEVPEGFKAELIRGEFVMAAGPTPASASGLSDYVVERTTEFGEPVPLGPVGVVLDTSELRTYS